MHTVSEGSGLLREAADYSGGLLWCRGLSLPALSHALVQLLSVVSLWYYQLRLLLKHTTHKQKAGGLQETVSRQRPPVLRGRESVAHHWSHHDQQKEADVRKKSTLVCFFFVFFSTS